MKIALLGNPNTGKSSVFNLLTGLRQHVGNFPGVTVEKRFGPLKMPTGENHVLIDFPGTYSIYPRSKDEEVVYTVLSDKKHVDFPDMAIVVADAANLERNLLLFTQVYDLGLPTILVLNMTDIANKRGKKVDVELLQQEFPTAKIVETVARVGLGKDRIFEAISNQNLEANVVWFSPKLCSISDLAAQAEEAEARYERISKLVDRVEQTVENDQEPASNKFDKFIVHPIFGYLLFGLVLLVIFQFIYAFAAIPMDFIDGVFAEASGWLASNLPSGLFTDLLCEGIIPGIGGVIVFLPQIALLFFFISILEETGYLARVVFIMDRLMRPLGLNGKSVVPLMSSVACAIPGVMAARTISDWKERLITILVAPLMSCSARIPVYTLLISLVIPQKLIWGFFNLQGLVLFALYSLGVVAALVVSLILKLVINSGEKGFLLLELPSYKAPRWKNVGITVWEKVTVFLLDAGKVILAISVILWALATFGPSQDMYLAEQRATIQAKEQHLSVEEKDQLIASTKLEHSYIGHLGKWLEPAIQPLGYDWKIGISLITSFAAREVFVGSLATIYAVHDESEENKRLMDRLKQEKRADGTPVYSLASGVSLMVFYVFAMQCMATLAVVKKETFSWKWPILQMVFMGALAYFSAMLTFQLMAV